MSIVVKDIQDGAEINRTVEGLEAIRIFQVSGLTGNRDVKLLNAILANGIPQRGEQHPSIPELAVSDISASPQGAENAEVSVTYKVLPFEEQEPDENQPPILTVGTTVQEDLTNLDIFGQQMLLNHTGVRQGKRSNETRQPDKLPTQPGELAVQFPQTTISLQRREPNNPLFKSQEFAGKINSAPIFGDPPHVWLCTGITGTTDDGGESYNVTYEFQRSAVPDTWDPIIVYIDTETDAPIATENFFTKKKGPAAEGEVDADEVGIKKVQVYNEIDFNQLNIDFGFSSRTGRGGIGLIIRRQGFSRLQGFLNRSVIEKVRAKKRTVK